MLAYGRAHETYPPTADVVNDSIPATSLITEQVADIGKLYGKHRFIFATLLLAEENIEVVSQNRAAVLATSHRERRSTSPGFSADIVNLHIGVRMLPSAIPWHPASISTSHENMRVFPIGESYTLVAACRRQIQMFDNFPATANLTVLSPAFLILDSIAE